MLESNACVCHVGSLDFAGEDSKDYLTYFA